MKAAYQAKRKHISQILDAIPDGADLIIPLANGEPDSLLQAIDEQGTRWKNVRIHQMHDLKDRAYIQGEYKGHIQYISYFLSHASRKSFLNGTCDLIPNHFHQMPQILRQTARNPIVLAQSSPMDEEGYFSLGTNADYVATFIGEAPIYLEVNQQMPRSFGQNQVHISQIEGFIEVDRPLHEVHSTTITDVERRIGEFVAERICDGDTIQAGIGGIPDAVIESLTQHRDLGVHTELLTDGMVHLFEKGVFTGSQKRTHPGKMVATFALGSKHLYEFMHENDVICLLPVDQTNDPRYIAFEDNMVSINATTEVDLFGQCASETIAGRYYSSSGGQVDFVTGTRFAKNGRSFLCLRSTVKQESITCIKVLLTTGSIVTTSKNDVDHIVTEYGVAELRGKSLSERAKALIRIAHPKFRDELTYEAKKSGILI
ncbi:4-hydroxybutyrate CoA-transferase [Collibacillus ludicampi]|uniref:4-hydroxybutyrate CoA-transferase n=1 Tax=Collibacillus ludicampi TaxID=2771369 RepID=A0AAV4LIY9_9BACL|nr:acetyl-CoA hydrolase/transferase C-terminal domain-containing protein [Collibacillus ludicampi]GIM47733.1 4-hydroxybutyrate CoA-transferase [Collibacillus ludicampi]